MNLHELGPAKGSRKKRKRIGRGPGSGHGKTAGKGHKGLLARSGGRGRQAVGFEGGQMSLIRRVPKHGFTNKATAASKSAGVNYDEKADVRSWAAMRAFFDEAFR